MKGVNVKKQAATIAQDTNSSESVREVAKLVAELADSLHASEVNFNRHMQLHQNKKQE